MSTERLLSWAALLPPAIIAPWILYRAVEELDGAAAMKAFWMGVFLAGSAVAALVKRAREMHGRAERDQDLDSAIAQLRSEGYRRDRDIGALRCALEAEQASLAATQAMSRLIRRGGGRHLQVARDDDPA